MIWTALATVGSLLKRVPWLDTVPISETATTSSLFAGINRFIFGREAPQIFSMASAYDCCPPIDCLVVKNSTIPTGIVAIPRAIPIVFSQRNKPKVGQSIIGPVAVDMVDLHRRLRPFSMNDCPRDAVGEVGNVENRSRAVAARRRPHRWLACKSLVPQTISALIGEKFQRAMPPSQTSRFGVIIQKLTKDLRVKYFSLSHSALHLRLRSGPRGVGSTVAGRFFLTESRFVRKQMECRNDR